MLNDEEMKQIEDKVEEVGKKLIKSARRERSLMKHIKRRLYAYPQLKKNLERYELDIEDIKKETFGKSKSLTFALGKTGGSYDRDEALEKIREEKILEVDRKIERDQAEINEIERGLMTIKDDPYYRALTMSFFEGKKQKEIAETMPCVETTIWRNVGRLIDKLAVFWYGADALKE